MESFTKSLVFNASAQLFPDNTLRSFTNFFIGATESGMSVGRCHLGNILPINQCTKLLLREKSCFFLKKNFKSSDFYYLEPGLYPSIRDIAEAMNTFIQERHNHH